MLSKDGALLKPYCAFILSFFENCFLVWCPASDPYVKLFDGGLDNIWFFLPDILIKVEKPKNFVCVFI